MEEWHHLAEGFVACGTLASDLEDFVAVPLGTLTSVFCTRFRGFYSGTTWYIDLCIRNGNSVPAPVSVTGC